MCESAYIAYITKTGLINIIAVFTPCFIDEFFKILIVLYLYSRMRNELTYDYS